MNRSLVSWLGAIVLISGVLCAQAGAMSHDMVKAGDLVIINAHSTATPPGAKVAAGYMKIENRGSQDDVLQSITASFSDAIEFHTMEMQNDVMKMRELTEPVVIPAGAEFVFSAGAEHIMFKNLSEPLMEGHAVSVTLVFENAGSVEVQLKVLKPGMAETMGHSDGHKGMDKKKKSP